MSQEEDSGRGSRSIVSNDTELKKGDKDLVGLSE